MEFSYTFEEMNELGISMGKFNNSMNFITGLTNLPDDFDILHNPYLDYIGYELTPGVDDLASKVVINPKHELKICTKEYLDTFITEKA